MCFLGPFWALLAIVALAGCGARPAVPDAPAPEVAVTGAEAPRGLRALFARAPEASQTDVASAAAPADDAPDAALDDGAVAAPDQIAAAPEVQAPRRGLFGLFGGGRAGDASGAAPAAVPVAEVARGGALPFGAVATACGLSARDLGPPVDRAPREGRARWRLHDTDAAATGQRTLYVTGFDDRCARQITGALVLFGKSDVHETTRYSSTNTRPYNATDDAYEQVKSRICGVRPRVPCPADRFARLDRSVSFVTVYSRFGATDEWFELLLVDGRLAAAAMSGF